MRGHLAGSDDETDFNEIGTVAGPATLNDVATPNEVSDFLDSAI